MNTRPACELIGYEGSFRLPGGRTIYEAVMWDGSRTTSARPRLARLVAGDDGIRQINRYVDWEQPIEVLADQEDDQQDDQNQDDSTDTDIHDNPL